MKEAGVEEEFEAHSTRHALTSKASSKGLDINIIKKTAGWLRNSTTFAKFYKRPIKDLDNTEAVFSLKKILLVYFSFLL